MATLATTGSLGTPLTTAYGGMVKLGTGEVVSCLKFQQLYNAAPVGSKPTIATVLHTAYSNSVKLSDGSIMTLPEFQKMVLDDAGTPPEIVSILGPGYGASTVNAGEVKQLAKQYIK